MEHHDAHLERLVKENIRLSRENNKLLKKIRRGNLLSTWFRVMLFLFIIGVPFFIYRYYVEDYVIEYRSMYNDLKKDVNELKSYSERLPF